MVMVKSCCRLVSCYGKERLASQTGNAIVCTRHDHILKRNVKPEPLGVVVGTYGLLNCVQNISSRATRDKKDKPLKNAGSKKGSNEVDENGDANYLDAAKFAVEQHNREYGTQLKFVELGKSHLSSYTLCSEHGYKIYLRLKVIDEKGKVAYCMADVTSRGGSFASTPLLLLTNQMFQRHRTTISDCFSYDVVPKF